MWVLISDPKVRSGVVTSAILHLSRQIYCHLKLTNFYTYEKIKLLINE